MPDSEANYPERRAEDAIRLAQTARHPAAVRAHYVMASKYLSRLDAHDDAQTSSDPQTQAALLAVPPPSEHCAAAT